MKIIKQITAFNGLSSYSKFFSSLPDFQIIGFTIYVFFCKKRQKLKRKKFILQIIKNILIKYDGHIIYQMHIKN